MAVDTFFYRYVLIIARKKDLSVQIVHFSKNKEHWNELAILTIPVSDFSSTEPVCRWCWLLSIRHRHTNKKRCNGWMNGRMVRWLVVVGRWTKLNVFFQQVKITNKLSRKQFFLPLYMAGCSRQNPYHEMLLCRRINIFLLSLSLFFSSQFTCFIFFSLFCLNFRFSTRYFIHKIFSLDVQVKKTK